MDNTQLFLECDVFALREAPRLPLKTQLPIEIGKLARVLVLLGYRSIAVAPHRETHIVLLPMQEAKPRTSKLNHDQQKAVWEAAQVRREFRAQVRRARLGMTSSSEGEL